MEASIKLLAKPVDATQGIICPLCSDKLFSLREYERHVGRHQEQLALFALPSVETDHNEDQDDDGAAALQGRNESLRDLSAEGSEGRAQSDVSTEFKLQEMLPADSKHAPQGEQKQVDVDSGDAQDRRQPDKALEELAPLHLPHPADRSESEKGGRYDYSDESDHHDRRQKSGWYADSHSRASSSGHSYIEAARNKRDRERVREGLELQQAKQELDEIYYGEDAEQEEKRIRKEIELKKLEEEEKAHEEDEMRKRMAEEAIRKWKDKEIKKAEKQRNEKEKRDREYQDRMRADLLASGLDERSVEAILEKKDAVQQVARPTYTRMALRHLEVETLIYYKIDFEYDQVSIHRLSPRRGVPGVIAN